MQQLTGTRKALLEALLTFIQVSVYSDSTTRMREWNQLYSQYGERLVPTLKDVAHQAAQCRVINAEARRSGRPLDVEAYQRHMVMAKSMAHGGAEDW